MKKFFVSLILCLSIVFNYNFIYVMASVSYAAQTITSIGYTTEYNIYDRYKYSGTTPTESSTLNLDFALTDISNPSLANIPYSRLFTNATAGDIELHFCDSAGNPYLTTVNNGTYTVTSVIAGVKSLSYTTTQMQLSVAGNISGDLDLYYYGSVNEGGNTYNTNVSLYKITFSNEGVYYKNDYNGEIRIDANDIASYTFDENFVKSYVLAYCTNGTTYSANELSYGATIFHEATGTYSFDMSSVIDKNVFNEEQLISIYLYKNDILSLVGAISVYIEKSIDVEDNLAVYIGGQLVSGTTPSSRHNISISAGQSITGNVTTTTSYKDITISLTDETFFSVAGYTNAEEKESSDPTEYNFIIRQKEISIGSFDVNLIVRDFVTGYQEIIYLTINATTTQKPVILLNANELEYYKGESVDSIITGFRENVRSVTLYDGSTLDWEVIADDSKLIITHDLTDTSVAGTYVINYTYTDSVTKLVGTASAMLVIIDRSPEIISVTAKESDTDKNVSRNEEVPLGTALYFIISAGDDDDDVITYHATSSKGTIEQDPTDETRFTFIPTVKMAGQIVFTFYVSDGYSTSENYYYAIVFKDETPPTITLVDGDNDDTINLTYDEGTGKYTLQVRRDKTVWFRNHYLEGVSDNSSTLSVNDVVITPVGFSFSGVERYSFTTTGTYSVIYSISDDSGNETSVTVDILIKNQPPTAQNKSYEFTYDESIILNLSSLATDDASGVEFVSVGGLTDQEGLSLIANVFDFGTDGNVEIEIASIYSETQERQVPFVGVAYLRYKAIDSDGELSEAYVITLNIVDKTAPQTTLVQGKTTTFIKGREYNDFSINGYFTAFDEVDGEVLPVSIKIYQNGTEKQSIDFTTIGEYQLVYLFKDSSNNEAPRSVSIYIVSGGNPTIEMLATSANIPVGGNFNIYDFLYRISDDEDGRILSGWAELREQGFLNIDDSSVDTNVEGTYTIRLYFVDSDGNSSSVVEFILTVEGQKEFPMDLVYYGAGALGLIFAIIIIRVIVVKRRMRI